MANPFAYEEYRREKIRQKIEETRAQRVQLKVNEYASENIFIEWCIPKCILEV